MATDPTPVPARAWHTLDAAAVAAKLGSGPVRGLAEAAVAARQAQYGPNATRAGRRRNLTPIASA
jgi:hypothetical protein